MTLTSPNKHYVLRVLDGNHDDVGARGKYLVELATTMEKTAKSLTKISEGTTQIAVSVNKVREKAGEIDGDLSKAATRYRMTGETLNAYAIALRTAHQSINPIIDDIEAAHKAAESAREEADDAKDKLEGLDTTWPWEDEPTQQDKDKAASASSTAAGAAKTAENHLNGLWEQFETAFGKWSEGYDEAVKGIQKAMDTADNNDGFWENLDDFLDVLGWVITGLAILALFLTGPIAALVIALVVVFTIISLIGHIVQVANGKGSWTDIVFDVIGLATFGIGAAGARTLSAALRGPGFKSLITGGRNAVQAGIRANLPNFFGVKNLMNGVAFIQSRLGTIGPIFNMPWKTIRMGNPNTAQFSGFVDNIAGKYGSLASVDDWLRSPAVQEALPNGLAQVGNSALWTVGIVSDGFDKFGDDLVDDFEDWVNPKFEALVSSK
jgi:hypothetical protein